MTPNPKSIKSAIAALSLTVAGCVQSEPPTEAEPEWQRLPDGSHLTTASFEDMDRDDIERCFETQVGVECLRAVSMVGGNMISLDRQFRPSLDSAQPVDEFEHTMEGYQCTLYQDGAAGDFIRESIWSSHGQLRVNTAQVSSGSSDAPYSKDEVEAYFEANSIAPKNPWLNCYAVAQLVVEGSLASLTSSDLTVHTFTSD